MLASFLTYIKKEKLFDPGDKILLTVSGGIDSVVMCELYNQAKLNFGIAHCNFDLRGDESDGDETFVEALAEHYHVPFHHITFETNKFAKKHKLSIQAAARELRYAWFEEIREHYNYKHISTAHHRDDSVETFFINLIRGTGISGLHGILPRHGNIIRPLLFTHKDEIRSFAKKSKLEYREDSSNASEKYLRNNIRLKLIPLLKELNPGIENTIALDIDRLQDVEMIFKNDIESKRKKIVKEEKNSVFISIKELKRSKPVAAYLFEFLKPYGFNSASVKEIIHSLDSISGKQFFSETHRLIKDREFLLVEAREKEEQKSKKKDPAKKNEEPDQWIKKTQKKFERQEYKLHLSLSIISRDDDFCFLSSKKIAALDLDKLQFPLEIRKWQKGDTFRPLGMKGNKKLSDFFIDEKFSISKKENTWLLISNGNIVWVIGERIDDRFKITDKTKKIYFVNLV